MTATIFNFLIASARRTDINAFALMASAPFCWNSTNPTHQRHLSPSLSQSKVLTPSTHKINNLRSISSVIDAASAVMATYFTLPKLNRVHCQLGRDCGLYVEN